MKATQRQHIRSMRSQAKELRRIEKKHRKLAEIYGSQALDLEKKVAALTQQDGQFAQQHQRVPHPGAQPLFQIRLKRIQLARRCWTWAVLRSHPRRLYILANRLAVPAGQLADRLDAHPLPL